ncbi:MAG: class I SAM-dependent methyltransferase [Desulfomonile tiedjei]|nr:class I SAM-dependent methyltransferase [Desulfomonile tiedjei]
MNSRSVETEYVTCDLCGSDEQTVLYSRMDPVSRAEYHLVECGCGMAFVNPMPKTESIPLLYPEDYLKDKENLEFLYSRMIKLLPGESGGRLLDIGCGRGDFIAQAAKKGWDVEGVDLLDWNTPHPVTIRVGDFLQMKLPKGYYDVITAWAMLEHVRKPSAFFEKVSALLRPNGCFVFVVPNFGAPGMRHSCTEDIPRHLWLFTPQAVNAYLAKYGMAPVSVLHDDRLYTSYPFGLVRYALGRVRGKPTNCSRFENKSVALLRNRQVRGNLREWLGEVFRKLGPVDIAIDTLDLIVGVLVANWSKLIKNYGVITVTAGKSDAFGQGRQKKSNPKLEDC